MKGLKKCLMVEKRVGVWENVVIKDFICSVKNIERISLFVRFKKMRDSSERFFVVLISKGQ